MKHPVRPIGRHQRGSRLRRLLSGLLSLGLPLSLAAAEPSPAPQQPAPETESAQTPETGEEAKAPEAESAEGEAAAAEPTPLEPAPGEYRNWFDVSVGGLLIDGDKAAAQKRLGLPGSAFGGVDEFHFEKDVGKRGLFRIDGRGIFDNEDYRLRIEYSEPDKGFVRGGITQHRQYYDGSGGWFPGNNLWFDLYDDKFELVRGSAFFEAGLRLPNIPEITIRYSHDYRDGLTDSTIWGGTTLTGGAGLRAIVPAFRSIDEKTDTVSLDVRHTLGKTTFGGAFTYQNTDVDNSLNLRRQPFETSDRFTTQTEKIETDLYSARVFADAILSDRLRFTTAYMFTTLEADLGGSRIIGSDYDPIYDPINARRDVGFLNLSGWSDVDQHVWNLNLMWTPFPNFSVIPAVRIENQDVDGHSAWLDTGSVDLAREAENSRDMLDLSQQIEIRYTGITNVVLYARGDWVEGDGNLFERQILRDTSFTELRRDSDFDRFSQKYTVGAHWYPLRQLNLHAQYYRKMRDSSFSEDELSYLNLSGGYPGFIRDQNFDTDDLNLRVTWKPLDKLTLVTRYDFQWNTIDMRGSGLDDQNTSQSTAHIIGQTITWTPLSRLYIQPSINYVLDKTRFPGQSGAYPFETARNDYFNVQCTAGLVVDDRTDLQAHYTYYRADNFNSDFAESQPYGAGAEEHGILASLIRRIHPRLRVSLRYGFFSGRSETSGGFNDYDAHLLMSTAHYLF